ncbi:MAG: hypothetical protein DRO14_02095 [Thermoprotei archaeon]|nr:MAG: hypothetical protein DRO14_02095 [Thermoprotei archaeon]
MEIGRVRRVMSQTVNTSNLLAIQQPYVLELQRIPSQSFSDSNEVVELRNDLTHVYRLSEEVVPITRLLILSLVKVLWKSIRPKIVLSLRPGEVKKISGNLLVEKTIDGKIILYEVTE